VLDELNIKDTTCFPCVSAAINSRQNGSASPFGNHHVLYQMPVHQAGQLGS
jgi:hypothetical protein